MRDVKVLDVEKALLPQGLDERLGKFLLSLGSAILGKVESDKLGPVEIFLRGMLNIRLKFCITLIFSPLSLGRRCKNLQKNYRSTLRNKFMLVSLR